MKLSDFFSPDLTKLDTTQQATRSQIRVQYILFNVIGAFVLVMSVVTILYGTSENILNYIPGVGFLVGAIVLFRLARKYHNKAEEVLSTSILQPPEINPFNVAHPVTRGIFGVPTVLIDDEEIITPTAPIMAGGWKATSIEKMGLSETNNQSVNTMICTNHQIICALVGYEDVPSGLDAGYVNSMDETRRNYLFTFLHKDSWHTITDNALKSGLPDFIAHHFSYAFPYGSISNIKPATHLLLNHSLDIELTDGKVISYTFLNADDRTPVLEQLKSYVNIVEE